MTPKCCKHVLLQLVRKATLDVSQCEEQKCTYKQYALAMLVDAQLYCRCIRSMTAATCIYRSVALCTPTQTKALKQPGRLCHQNWALKGSKHTKVNLGKQVSDAPFWDPRYAEVLPCLQLQCNKCCAYLQGMTLTLCAMMDILCKEGCRLKRAMSPSIKWRSTVSPTLSSAASLRRSPYLRYHLLPPSNITKLAPGQVATPASCIH